jgi:hypothetical protein
MGGAESGELTKLYEGNLAVVWYRKIQALWPMSSVQGATGIVTGAALSLFGKSLGVGFAREGQFGLKFLF